MAARHVTATQAIPHDLYLEQSLLAIALGGISGQARAVAHLVELDLAVWYKPSHATIADAIRRIAAAGRDVDLVSVTAQLRDDGMLDHIGGNKALLELATAPETSSNPDTAAKQLADLAQRRRVLTIASDLSDLAARSDAGTALASARDLLDHEMRAIDRPTNLEVPDIAKVVAGNLEPETTTILTRRDGMALLYPGRLHSFSAEPEAGKSWIALAACVEVITAGGAAIYVDWEDTPTGIISRCLALGTPAADLVERFAYVRPLGTWGPAEVIHMATLCSTYYPDLVVLDGVAEALQRDGLAENEAADWVSWVERVARPIARTGATVVMLDHVTKTPDGRGRYARGTGAKLASIDGAAYELHVTRPFSRNEAGAFEVLLNKDRLGFIRGDSRKVAVATLTPHAGGARVEFELYSPDAAPAVGFRPTEAMEHLSEVLETGDLDLKAAAAQMPTRVRKPTVTQALAALVREGYVEERHIGGKRVLHSVRPFRRHPTDTDTPPIDADRRLDF